PPPPPPRPPPADIACLPGPPTEMRGLFDAHIRPLLRPARRIVTRALHAFGLGESDVATLLADLMGRDRNPLVGTTVRRGVVTCRIRFETPADERQSGTLLAASSPRSSANPPLVYPVAPPEVAAVERTIRERLGPYLFGDTDDTLASVLVRLLGERKETLATVESCTGGLLGGAITTVPGCSATYRGGWVTYTNELKSALVGVPDALLRAHGAVSGEVAGAMAAGGLERSGADHCLAITGIAGPDGGTPDKPVGTVWIAACSRGPPLAASSARSGAPATVSRRLLFAGTRDTIRAWSVASALAMLRLRLIGEESIPLLREVPG
ncbi:MAG: nicotinamide-nucleotide amidohydrolase family protein, partial [Phycisphaerales bacterium]